MRRRDRLRRPSPGVPLALAGLILVFAGACGDGAPAAPGTPGTSTPATPSIFDRGTAVISTDGGEVRLDVEIARTDEARQQGLMHRTELPADAGMVFLFDEEGTRSFWMKNTLIPLSIAFFDARGRIGTILDMEPCTADPCPYYLSEGPAQGALEVNLGAFADLGVKTGDVVRIEE